MTDTRFKIIDLVGKRFSRWVVESYAGSDGRNATWMCACDCGNKRVVRASHLKSGGSTNCGCWSRDRARKLSTKHGEVTGGKRSREYIAWQSMRSRCLYPKNIRFNEYGGRGITICDRWSVFENFLADMGRKPTAKHSLDRIDNNGNYEPGNCRWATATEQNRNRRKLRPRRASVNEGQIA